MLRVTAGEPIHDRHLRVTFNDGVVREVDCSFLFHGTLGDVARSRLRLVTELCSI
jgi:hypothetical protein